MKSKTESPLVLHLEGLQVQAKNLCTGLLTSKRMILKLNFPDDPYYQGIMRAIDLSDSIVYSLESLVELLNKKVKEKKS